MLFDYIQQCQRFLSDEGQPVHNPADLTRFINEARGQIALGSECLRQPAQLTLVANQQSYLFSSATFVGAPTVPAGLSQVANVRMARLFITATGGYKRLEMRSWEYFETFWLDRIIPAAYDPVSGPGGPPIICARLQPGLSGTIWFAPVPDRAYTVILDSVAWPVPLVYANGDTDPEAIPAPWQDAVPRYATYLALMSAGDDAGASRWWDQYLTFECRATQMTTPSRLPRIYPGGAGATTANSHMPLTSPQATRR